MMAKPGKRSARARLTRTSSASGDPEPPCKNRPAVVPKPMTLKDALLAFATILIFAAAVYLSIEDGNQWNKFKAEHQCRITTHVPGYAFNNPKDGWTCDDGKTYFR
jgi:hypothetical protein